MGERYLLFYFNTHHRFAKISQHVPQVGDGAQSHKQDDEQTDKLDGHGAGEGGAQEQLPG